MKYNENKNSLSENNSTGQTEREKCDYSEHMKKCGISNETADFLACILYLYELNDKVFETVTQYFGEQQVEQVNVEYEKKSRELESVIFDYVRDSIFDKVTFDNFNSI